ncbi:MAG: peptidylprolyl isomerase [Candidatus Eiseniibacteriota bacterium]
MIVPETMPMKPAMAPAHIVVQHILIGFAGSVPGKPITRSKDEAKKLAYELLDKARRGANFDTLVTEYTDDRPPGIYKMAAIGVSHAMGEFPRENMVPAFGDVGFNISPGNIDIADYDTTKSPYGWHIIKRLQ